MPIFSRPRATYTPGMPRMPGMNSRDSTDILDFLIVVDQEGPQLMSVSISMGSLWSIDSDSSIPSFPSRPPPPMDHILIGNRSMNHPFGPGRTGPDHFKILTSIATPPRIKNTSLEPLCIDRWVAMTIARASPPGHIPWKAGALPKEVPWVASGSMLSPSLFKPGKKLLRSRGFKTFVSVKSSAKEEQASRDQDYVREAVVFQRELTPNADGEPIRLSPRVPATSMDPEMVDIMLELQDLNSFFKDSLEDLDSSVAALEKEKDKLNLPILSISGSQHTPTPPSLAPQRQTLPLAARRGKSPPSPISLVKNPPLEPYPSIPTAFLGSPSTYSPQFEHTRAENRVSLDLMNMVTKLRTQCDSLHKVSDLPVESPGSVTRSTAPSDQGNIGDQDDWAFAVSFFDELGDNAQAPQMDHNQKLDSSHIPEEVMDGGNACTPPESGILHVHIPAHVPPSPCPSMPLPATPPLQGTVNLLSPPGTVRGILKSSKNVRFASLPEPKRSGEDSFSDDSPTSSAFSSPPLASPHTPQRPPRLRAYARHPTEDGEDTPHTYNQRSSDAQLGLKQGGINDNLYSASVSPSTPDDPFRPKSDLDQASQLLHGARRGSLAPDRDSALFIRGRHSFGRFSKMDRSGRKEKKTPMSPSPRGKAGSRWTMNDMTFRRGSSSSQSSPPEGSSKSRMPVPLRNILTRLKEK